MARIATSMHLPKEPQYHTRKWYFSRQEIEDFSPSRRDGIDAEKESQLRKLYCSFIKELGVKLKVPQVTIACALILCHRFYMRQSHAKNDWKTMASASMFLACKLEETPRLLRDVVVVAYELMHKRDPSASHRIRQIGFCSSQKELLVTGERLLLATIGFDLDVQLPYKPLVNALKKLNIYPDLAKVAWNFVNDWLCTTLCLQYKPHYIAAGSMYLAAKFQKVKLPTEKGNVWWLEFDISPKQLEEVIQQMARLLEQDPKRTLPATHGRVPQSKASAKKMVTSSAQSAVTSVSMSNSLASDGAVMEASSSSDRNTSLNEVLPCQTIDSGASSVVEDGDGKNQPRTGDYELSSSSNIAPSYNSHHNIDVHQIRETLKRRRSQIAAKSRASLSNETMDAELDTETWIERELEEGIELQTAPSEKKRRKV
ncbi:cyclin-T1-3-like [Populus alba x Populus x berolinensis]|uniref:B-like cyclin n=2 Tax=Populus alba TaxID=43335 RepID=A0A4U5QHM4_POPAL|nr:cyclin-T1-3-like [Populus alba]KAJ6953605.1 cyclin-T1-3-like [Populus alba x Populus x berolinensis]TKS10138.1 cyclin family protein [Populus alba]